MTDNQASAAKLIVTEVFKGRQGVPFRHDTTAICSDGTIAEYRQPLSDLSKNFTPEEVKENISRIAGRMSEIAKAGASVVNDFCNQSVAGEVVFVPFKGEENSVLSTSEKQHRDPLPNVKTAVAELLNMDQGVNNYSVKAQCSGGEEVSFPLPMWGGIKIDNGLEKMVANVRGACAGK